jgi:hypothetical protein
LTESQQPPGYTKRATKLHRVKMAWQKLSWSPD